VLRYLPAALLLLTAEGKPDESRAGWTGRGRSTGADRVSVTRRTPQEGLPLIRRSLTIAAFAAAAFGASPVLGLVTATASTAGASAAIVSASGHVSPQSCLVCRKN